MDETQLKSDLLGLKESLPNYLLQHCVDRLTNFQSLEVRGILALTANNVQIHVDMDERLHKVEEAESPGSIYPLSNQDESVVYINEHSNQLDGTSSDSNEVFVRSEQNDVMENDEVKSNTMSSNSATTKDSPTPIVNANHDILDEQRPFYATRSKSTGSPSASPVKKLYQSKSGLKSKSQSPPKKVRFSSECDFENTLEEDVSEKETIEQTPQDSSAKEDLHVGNVESMEDESEKTETVVGEMTPNEEHKEGSQEAFVPSRCSTEASSDVVKDVAKEVTDVHPNASSESAKSYPPIDESDILKELVEACLMVAPVDTSKPISSSPSKRVTRSQGLGEEESDDVTALVEASSEDKEAVTALTGMKRGGLPSDDFPTVLPPGMDMSAFQPPWTDEKLAAFQTQWMACRQAALANSSTDKDNVKELWTPTVQLGKSRRGRKKRKESPSKDSASKRKSRYVPRPKAPPPPMDFTPVTKSELIKAVEDRRKNAQIEMEEQLKKVVEDLQEKGKSKETEAAIKTLCGNKNVIVQHSFDHEAYFIGLNKMKQMKARKAKRVMSQYGKIAQKIAHLRRANAETIDVGKRVLGYNRNARKSVLRMTQPRYILPANIRATSSNSLLNVKAAPWWRKPKPSIKLPEEFNIKTPLGSPLIRVSTVMMNQNEKLKPMLLVPDPPSVNLLNEEPSVGIPTDELITVMDDVEISEKSSHRTEVASVTKKSACECAAKKRKLQKPKRVDPTKIKPGIAMLGPLDTSQWEKISSSGDVNMMVRKDSSGKRQIYNLHSKSEDAMYCIHCKPPLLLPNRETLNQHLILRHSERDRMKCSICEIPFISLSSLYTHMTCQHLPGSKDNTTTTSKVSKTLRLSQDIRPVIGNYQCEVCKGKIRIQSWPIMLKHMRLHQVKLNNGSISCKVCNKTFPTQTGANQHSEVHIWGDKPFSCSFCSKRFIRKYDCIKHIQIHYRSKNSKTVKDEPKSPSIMETRNSSLASKEKGKKKKADFEDEEVKFMPDLISEIKAKSLKKSKKKIEEGNIVGTVRIVLDDVMKQKDTTEKEVNKEEGKIRSKVLTRSRSGRILRRSKKNMMEEEVMAIETKKETVKETNLDEKLDEIKSEIEEEEEEDETVLYGRNRRVRAPPVTPATGVYICSSCDHTEAEWDQILKHMASHLSEPNVCGICKTVLRRKQYVMSHMSLHVLGTDPYKCEKCGMGYRELMSFKAHSKKCKEVPIVLDCSICKKNFKRSGQLRAHILSHLDYMDRICKICCLVYDTAQELQLHNSQEHLIACSQCDEIFNTKNKFEYHFKRVHENPSDWKKCPVCSKSFPKMSQLSRHIDTHTENRKHACHFCKLKFKQACHLKNHIRKMHHQGNQSMPHKCEVCSMGFINPCAVQQHMESKHAKQSDTAQVNNTTQSTVVTLAQGSNIQTVDTGSGQQTVAVLAIPAGSKSKGNTALLFKMPVAQVVQQKK